MIRAMLTGLTKREQKVLFFLIGIIAVGLAAHRLKGGARREITSPPLEIEDVNPTQREKTTISPDNATSFTCLVNVNTALLEELRSLHGVGEVKARAIMEYRRIHGGFKSLEEITSVKGVGKSTYNQIKDRITLGETPPVQTTPGDRGDSESPSPQAIHNEKEDKANHFFSGKVNINTAGLEELMTLDQIGEVKAKRILEYRERYGPFRSVRDLVKIRGIGEKTLIRNRDKITVSR